MFRTPPFNLAARRRAGVSLPPGTPLLWHKADAGVYVDAGTTLATNGQTVQQWNDQSGNGYHLSQATAGKRPTLQTNQFNGKPALLFDGVDDYLARASVPFGALAGMSLFVVTKYVAMTAFKMNFCVGLAAHELRLNATSQPQYSHASAAVSNSTGSTGILYRLGGVFDDAGDNIDFWLSGTKVGSAADVTAFEGTMDVSAGARTDGTLPLSGRIAETLIYGSKLTAPVIAQVFAYFTNRYG